MPAGAISLAAWAYHEPAEKQHILGVAAVVFLGKPHGCLQASHHWTPLFHTQQYNARAILAVVVSPGANRVDQEADQPAREQTQAHD